MKAALIFVGMIFLNVMYASAQCAMCRSTLENNFSNGDPGIGAGINTGILYLLVLPYLAVFALGYFWLKSTRKAKANLTTR